MCDIKTLKYYLLFYEALDKDGSKLCTIATTLCSKDRSIAYHTRIMRLSITG